MGTKVEPIMYLSLQYGSIHKDSQCINISAASFVSTQFSCLVKQI